MFVKLINLPKPTPEEQAYLDSIKAQGYMTPEQIAACTCIIGPGSRDPEKPPCPVHNR